MTSPESTNFGILTSGLPATSYEQCRDDMLTHVLTHETHHKENTSYYEGESRPQTIGIAVPPAMQMLLGKVGYPRLYIDSLSERLAVEGFRLGGADEADDKLWEWWQANDLDTESTLGHTEAFVQGRSYITISKPDPERDLYVDQTAPIIRIESARHLYALIDPRTKCVSQAIREVRGNRQFREGERIASTLYLPNATIEWTLNALGTWDRNIVKHDLGVVPVVPLPNRKLLSDLYGTTEITPELKSVTDAACRILMDLQGAAELMATPQRILFGVKPQDIGVDPLTGKSEYDAYMARILAFADPEGKAFQFAAAELSNFGSALDQLDRKAAQITGLPPQYISYSSENPASAEAIRASESRLVKNAEQKSKVFGGAWEQAMRIAYMVMNGGAANLPPEYLRMESIWADPSTPTYAAKADAASKLYANGMGLIPKERGRMDMGYSPAEREEMKAWDKEDAKSLLGAFGPLGPGAPGKPGASSSGGNAAAPADPAATQTVTTA